MSVGHTEFRSILVAYDGTPAASRIADTAMELARKTGVKLIVPGVVPPLSPEAASEGVNLEREQQFGPRLEGELAELARRARSLAVDAATEIVRGNPDESIEARIKADEAIDLLAVGHRSLSRVRRFLEGKSTAGTLLLHAKVSLLVIPEDDGVQ